jgi:hypothetical protein
LGEFSAKNLESSGGIAGALIAAILFVAVPVILYAVTRGGYSRLLTPNDAQALDTFFAYALILGTTITVTISLYCGYPKGARSRLFFGTLSGALIIAYAFIVLVMSGLTLIFTDRGIPLDTKYFALMVADASVILILNTAAEYSASRKRWLKSGRLTQTQGMNTR